MRFGDMVKIVNSDGCYTKRYGYIIGRLKIGRRIHYRVKVAGYNNIEKRYPQWVKNKPSAYTYCLADDMVTVRKATWSKRLSLMRKNAKKIKRSKVLRYVAAIIGNSILLHGLYEKEYMTMLYVSIGILSLGILIQLYFIICYLVGES